jgi:hypothetical protein
VKIIRYLVVLLALGAFCAAVVMAATRAPGDPVTRLARDPNRLRTYSPDLGSETMFLTNENPRTAREMEQHSVLTPTWTNAPDFQRDVFTFVRIHYDVNGRHGWGHSRNLRWSIDAPDSDLNLSWRLQQLTSLKVDPDGRILRITEKELFDYPFIYIVEPGRLTFSEEEAQILSRYLLNGGFLMFDDFWGGEEWTNFVQEIKMVFPNRPIEELPLTHPIFHCVFDLKERPLVPGLPHYRMGHKTERLDAPESDYRGIADDKGRLMVLICHNTDLGDGWEREGEDEGYFREYAEKFAYPLAVNILFYTMTH